MFEDTPAQLAAIAQALRQRQSRQAWEIAHKLHGGFCFYGFEDFRSLTVGLEQSLLNGDLGKAERHLQILQDKFRLLVDNQADVLAKFTE